MKQIEFHAMGSRIRAMVDSEAPQAERTLRSLPAWFEEWEQVLSRFRFDSELSRMNQAAGSPVKVSDVFWEVFQAGCEAEEFTGGLVRPTVMDALIQAGYDRSFNLMPEYQAAAPVSIRTLPAALSVITINETDHTIFLPEHVHLDFGGIAKGWAANKTAIRLRKYGSVLVDAGGDISISGLPRDNVPWAVGIRDPFQPNVHFETLRIEQGGVATSGTDYRRWQQGDSINHHLIDPGTGLPSTSDVLAATIIAPTILQAEAAAKVVVISGSPEGLEWLEGHPSLAGVVVLNSGEILYSRRMDEYLWR
jgi:thiamine biosynthesis lipoprotein